MAVSVQRMSHRARASQMAPVASILVFCLGCGKPEPQVPPPAPAGATASAETGTVKFEFDMPVDSKAVVTIGGSEYSPKDLEQDLKLPQGEHSISVKQPGLTLEPQPFHVDKNERRIVRVYDPNRRTAEWALGLGARLDIIADGKERQFTSLAKLPASFKIVAISLDEKSVGDEDLANQELYKTQITDAGLAHLKALKSLRSLQVKGSKVTNAGVADLKAALPILKVES